MVQEADFIQMSGAQSAGCRTPACSTEIFGPSSGPEIFSSGITRVTILALSRTRRFDRQVSVAPEAECSIHERHLLPAIEAEVLQQDAAILQTDRAFSCGPTRNSRVCRAVLDARIYIPAAKLHPVQVKLAATGQLSQKFVAAHAFGFHL